MKAKLKSHKYITKFGMVILGIIAVLLYLYVINIFFTKTYFPTIFKSLSSFKNEVTRTVVKSLLTILPVFIFYLIAPIDVFRIVYKYFRKDIFGY